MTNHPVEAQNEQIYQQLLPLLHSELGTDLLGVLAAGSRVHGTPGPTSDLDIHILISSHRRCRRTILLNDVEVEQFFNPPEQIREYFKLNPVDQSMFALGKILYDPQHVVADLKAEANLLWTGGPNSISPQEVWRHRHHPSDLLRDLDDVDETDQASCLLVSVQICNHLLETHYLLHQRWKPKAKRCLNDLNQWDPPAAQLARAALCSYSPAERRTALVALSDHVLSPLGGLMPLEWSTPWEPLSL